MIFCYTPTQRFTRIYITVPEGVDFRSYDKDVLWREIKRQYFNIEDGEDRNYWMDDEEEAGVRAEWFACWDEDRAWDIKGSIAIDSHY